MKKSRKQKAFRMGFSLLFYISLGLFVGETHRIITNYADFSTCTKPQGMWLLITQIIYILLCVALIII